MVFSGDVIFEQGTVLFGHSPSLFGLKVSTNCLPARLPQIVSPSNPLIYIGEWEIDLVQPLFLPPHFSTHSYSRPDHSLENTGSQPGIHPLFSTLISTNGRLSQSCAIYPIYEISYFKFLTWTENMNVTGTKRAPIIQTAISRF